MANIPYVIVNFGNQFKKILYIILLAPKWCGFQHTEQACPISCQFPDGLIYQHVSDSVPSRVLIKLEKSRAILAQHVIAPKQDLTQQLVLMRLGSLETSQAEPRELGRLQRLWLLQPQVTCHSTGTISATACRPGQSNQKKHALIPSTLLTSSLLSRCRSSLKQLQTDGTAKQCAMRSWQLISLKRWLTSKQN